MAALCSEGARPWSYQRAAATLQTLEGYVAALTTAKMVETPDRPEIASLPNATVATLHTAREWAIDMLLDLQGASSVPGAKAAKLPRLAGSKVLQQMQSKLFVSAPHREAELQMELHQSILGALVSTEAAALPAVLDMCATSLTDDAQFLQFAEAALSGEVDALLFGDVFLRRLFEETSVSSSTGDGHPKEEELPNRRLRLFDALTLESKTRVWANHLPSWHDQLQTWMLEALRAPFQPMSAVLPEGWGIADDSTGQWTAAGATPASAACRRYSHLYVTLVEWCHRHVDSLASCRSMELVHALSSSTRHGEEAARLFNRLLLDPVRLAGRPLNSSARWPSDQRVRAFLALGLKLQQLQAARSSFDMVWQYEWLGVLERPYLLHEALEAQFPVPSEPQTERSAQDEVAAQSAAHFFGWFYSFSSSQPADAIANLLTQMTSELKVHDVLNGAQWLRRSRADFGELPVLRLRVVWFWLLKSIDASLRLPAESVTCDVAAAATDVLESVEYVFRRFPPPKAKRAFQVELVAQLLLELEWRAATSRAALPRAFLKKAAPLCAWLAKIVRLMQVEAQTARQKGSSRRSQAAANDVQHLAERLRPFSS
ncbi:hypothetical protein BBJ28_00009029 [Nothophytophthora sp. Chile5]|nr:hypothetical protein BBJ28_00009029 [Nothophytophthora sp. Chile5]